MIITASSRLLTGAWSLANFSFWMVIPPDGRFYNRITRNRVNRNPPYVSSYQLSLPIGTNVRKPVKWICLTIGDLWNTRQFTRATHCSLSRIKIIWLFNREGIKKTILHRWLLHTQQTHRLCTNSLTLWPPGRLLTALSIFPRSAIDRFYLQMSLSHGYLLRIRINQVREVSKVDYQWIVIAYGIPFHWKFFCKSGFKFSLWDFCHKF